AVNTVTSTIKLISLTGDPYSQGSPIYYVLKKVLLDTNWCRIIETLIGVQLGKGWRKLNENKQERDVYIAIADPTRRELLRLLADAEELPLHELTSHFNMGRTAVSKHLTILKEAQLVTDRKVGRETRYRLNAILKEKGRWLYA